MIFGINEHLTSLKVHLFCIENIFLKKIKLGYNCDFYTTIGLIDKNIIVEPLNPVDHDID